MKSSIRFKFFVSLILLMVLMGNTLAQNSIYWNYPIKPGSEEWLAKTDFIERLKLLNIPEDTIKSMDTDRLLNICLEYPYFGLVFTRNSLQQGYEFIKSNFNGFRELEKRSDAGDLILIKYEGMDPTGVSYQSSKLESGQYMAQFTFIEILLSQDSILFKLNNETKKRTLKITHEKFSLKANDQNYGIEGLLTTAYIMAKIINDYDMKDLKLTLIDKSILEEFARNCTIVNPELFNVILKSYEYYLK